MQLRQEQLSSHLSGQLASCYLIAGDEPLLVQEAADAIRAATRSAGYLERERITITAKSDWQLVQQVSSSLSLFADKKLIEIHMPNGKPGTEGAKALQEYLAGERDDVLLIVSGKIDKASQRSRWFTTLDQRGVVMLLWPIKFAELPRWIERRLKSVDMSADAEAINLLAERVEGNLLAAVQEIEKLRLSMGSGTHLTVQAIRDSVLDSARFNPFDLVDVALAGDCRHALRTAHGLRAEGSAPPAILWALYREIRLLIDLRETMTEGGSIDQAMRSAGVWRNRMRLVQRAHERHSARSLGALERLALEVDGRSKGLLHGDPWETIEQLLVQLSQGAA